MTAATADRNTFRRAGTNYAFPMKGATKIYTGTLVCLLAGLAVNGRPGTGLFCAGVAQETVDNTNGDRKSTRLNSSHIQKSRMPSSA